MSRHAVRQPDRSHTSTIQDNHGVEAIDSCRPRHLVSSPKIGGTAESRMRRRRGERMASVLLARRTSSRFCSQPASKPRDQRHQVAETVDVSIRR